MTLFWSNPFCYVFLDCLVKELLNLSLFFFPPSPDSLTSYFLTLEIILQQLLARQGYAVTEAWTHTSMKRLPAFPYKEGQETQVSAMISLYLSLLLRSANTVRSITPDLLFRELHAHPHPPSPPQSFFLLLLPPPPPPPPPRLSSQHFVSLHLALH